ncbi:MAG: HAMP domain-containing sensor histidine kinase [Aquincola tertiaricarbonis]|uniref:sensor histidine kinase n=1 Tax=Aquincola tertiaricarbonis TaxID=391953 RepID=UPI000ACDF536|nr:HAMP domain-containing sensor histidine kinase [Aquincola tertiaricarbonis]
MMHDFLANNRDELVARCKAKVAARPGRKASDHQLQNGVPLFLEQLRQTLVAEDAQEGGESLRISGGSGGTSPATTEIGVSATAHGKALLGLGYSVNQVVHDYGDLCQAITELAFERDAPFSIPEFKTLNRCLDNAIADAVTAFSLQRDALQVHASAVEANERFGFLVHELRNALHAASLAVTAMQQGSLPVSGATGAVLKRSLAFMRQLLETSLTDVRAGGQLPVPTTIFSVADFIADVQHGAQLDADARGAVLVVEPVDPALQVEANRTLAHGALVNLLGNAFKFTHAHTTVHLRVQAADGQVRIAVEDHCGGLPPNYRTTLFRSFAQLGKDRSGLGLGLSIARQDVQAMGGTLTVDNMPGVGCVFTIGLRRVEPEGVPGG